MKASWLGLGVAIAVLFGGCTAFAGKVSAEWTPAFAVWVLLVVPLKALNDRHRKIGWPMEFLMWSVLLLIAINLLWLRYAP